MKRLFILSVDSLFYEDLEWLKDCPYLYEILQKGSLVKRMQSVYPAMTYVAHSTMLTGCYPDVHGIYHNEKVEIDKQFPDWYWRREELKVPTLIDYATEKGYRFAVVNWPVSGADEKIAYNIPEIWSDKPDGDGRPRFITVCSPEIVPLYDKYRHLLRWKYQPELDEFGVCCLQEVIEEHQPEVIMLHLSFLDHARHSTGVYTEEGYQALIECDKRFGRIVEQLKRLGLYEETNFAVFGDHGHMPVKQVFNPNVILREKGLIDLDENGLVKRWDAYCHSAGLSTHVVLADPENMEIRKKVEEIMAEMVADEKLGCEQIIDKKTLKEEWHLEGPFGYVIEGRLGTFFGNRCTEPMIMSTDNSDYKISVSAHGHMPTKGPWPTFFMAGPQIKQGVVVEEGNGIGFAGEAGEKPLQLWLDMLADESAFIPEGEDYASNSALRNAFMAGQCNIIMQSSAQYRGLADNSDFEVGVAYIPKLTNYAAIPGGSNIVAFEGKSEAEVEATWKFMKYLCSGDVAGKFAAGTGYLPTSEAALNSEIYQSKLAEYPDLDVAVGQLEYFVEMPFDPTYVEVKDNVVGRQVQECIINGKTPAEAVATMETETAEFYK